MNTTNHPWINSLRAQLAPALAAVLQIASLSGSPPAAADPSPGAQLYENGTGVLETINLQGRTDRHGAFFQSLGTNGRSCATCHVPDQAMSISPPQIRERYATTHGRDPLFAPVDGANCSNIERADRSGHSLLLRYGLIRVAIAIPASAQFTISVVHDPYGCALELDPGTGLLKASVYRRPLPAANLSFLSAVMWDGRETISPLTNGATFLDNLRADLTDQATSAVTGHAQGQTPGAKQLADIVDFELGLYTAPASRISATNSARLATMFAKSR
jgi:cytochrome c peroxidase